MISMIASYGTLFSDYIGNNMVISLWFAALGLCLLSEYYFKYYKENKND